MKVPRSRRFTLGTLALIVLLLGVAYVGRTLGPGHASGSLQAASLHLAMDADPANGPRPCDPIDASATAAVGSTYTVAVCLADYQANDLLSFQMHLTNNNSLSFAPDPQGSEESQNGGSGPDCGQCLDDNPDANDGDDPAGFKLGSGWACTGLGVIRPRSETPPIELVCNADVVSPDMDLSANPGLLATVTFRADAAGLNEVGFESWTSIGQKTAGQGYCGDEVPDAKIDCLGATINIGGVAAPTSTPSNTATPTTPTSTPSATGPGPTATPLPPGMEAVDLVAGCNPVASTYPDATAVQTIADNVGPAGIVDSLWEFEMGTWLGYSPQFPEVSDLREKDFLDVVFVCVSGPGVFVRPTVPA